MNMRLNILCVSVSYLVIGIILLLFPNVSLMDLCYALGIVLLMAGIVNIAVYFIRGQYVEPERYGFSAGVTCVLIGLFAVLNNQEFTRIFFQILAFCMILDSIVKLQYSMDLLRMKSKKWWIVLLISLMTAGLALAILVYPFKTDRGHDRYAYCILIVDGIVNLATMLYMAHWNKRFRAMQVQAKEEGHEP